MSRKRTIILLIFILILSFGVSSINLTQFESENRTQLRTAPTYTTQTIRPNGEVQNNGFNTIPLGVDINECIDDIVTAPSAGGDDDYIYGINVSDWCEISMGNLMLQPGESITAIDIYIRGSYLFASNYELSVNVRWRIGTGSYSSLKNVHFTQESFYWLSTGLWTGLNLNQADLNDLQIRLDLVGDDSGDPMQAISVLYAEVTIKSNANPTVNLLYPNGGEILRKNTLIEWSFNDPDGDILRFDLSYRVDGGDWLSIVSNLIDQSSFLWNISAIPPSDNVELLIEAHDGDTGYSYNISDGPFSIRYNHDPIVEFISPSQGDILREDVYITWNYQEVDEEPTFFNISYRINYDPWILIIHSLENQTSYFWEVTNLNGTYNNLSLLIEAYDPFNGYSNDTSQGFFSYIQNTNPQITIVSPNQGLEIKTSLLIEWNYTDLEQDTVFFNISYRVNESEWVDIVTELINETSYMWNLTGFYETLTNVTIRIVAYDQYFGYNEVVLPGTFIILGEDLRPPFIISWFELFVLLTSISIPGIIVVGYIVKKKKKKKKKELVQKKSTNELGVNQIQKLNGTNNQKRVIIEADLLVKRGKSPDKMDLLTRLIYGDNHKNQKNIDDEYEIIKVLGKLNITTLSEDFWNKIEKFEWQEKEKEDFINDMLGLAPECREKFINDMLNRFRGREGSYDS